jgi:type I restriction enzyme R subunit
MLNIFKNKSAHKIDRKAKAMIITSSRVAAVKYKLFMDEELKKQGLKYKTIIAFSGGIDADKLDLSEDEFESLFIANLKGRKFTEDGMNKPHNPQNKKTEELFEQTDNIRFLIVANKFQTGFNEPLLHTMFVDKPLRDKAAVQTLSRLNRMHEGKDDTLVIDFTGSYEQIMKAYKKYQKDVTSNKNSDPKVLTELIIALLNFNIFTNKEVREIVKLATSGDTKNMPVIVGLIHQIKTKFEKDLTRDKRDEFRILMGRYLGVFKYIKALFNIRDKEIIDFYLFLIYLNHKLSNTDSKSLEKELKDVRVVNYSIPELKSEVDEDVQNSGGGGGYGNITRVKETKTVKEVIEEINLQFKAMIGDEGVEIVGKFLEEVSCDQALIDTVINNKNKDMEKVFEEIMRAKLTEKLTAVIMLNAPEKYDDMMSDKVHPFINRTAYNVLRNVALAA